MPRIAAQQKSNQNGQQQKSNVETTTSVRWKTNIVEDSSTGKTTASKQKKTGILKKGRGKNSSQTLRKTKPKAVKVKVTRTTKDCVDRDKKKINKSKQSGDAEDNEHRNLRPKSTPQFTAINMPRILAVDTRILQTFQGDAAGSIFLEKSEAFLQMCSRRGVLPTHLSTPHAVVNGAGRVKIEARAACLPVEDLIKCVQVDVFKKMLVPVQVRGTSIATKSVPKSLLAHDSWRLFGDLVDIAVDAATNTTVQESSVQPQQMDLTLLTSDVALFTDLKSDSHVRGMQRFWDRVEGYFVSGNLNSIQMIVVETGSTIAPLGLGKFEEDRSSQNSDDGEYPLHQSRETSTRLRISEIIHTLHTKIRQNYSKKNVGSLELSLMECTTVAFGGLLRQWLRKIVGGSRISFQLPETMDGSVCSIALGLEYTILPYSLCSPEGQYLINEANLLKSLPKFEVIHVVSFQSIDASLIFGVPMIATAGLESDIARYQEMQTLVRQLWKWLNVNDVAIVLRSAHSVDDAGDLFQHQYFILMTDESPMDHVKVRRGAIAMDSGILFRYAAEEQLLHDPKEQTGSKSQFNCDEAGGTEGEEETDRQYFDHIERSMEYLERPSNKVINPVFLKSTGFASSEEKPKFASKYLDGENDDTQDTSWDEEEGVGVAAAPHIDAQSAEDDLPGETETETAIDFTFDYN